MNDVCPHGDRSCPCPDGDSCHYEGNDAMPCPRQTLLKRDDVATYVDDEPMFSMTQARPGLPGWACGWLRSPGNESSRAIS